MDSVAMSESNKSSNREYFFNRRIVSLASLCIGLSNSNVLHLILPPFLSPTEGKFQFKLRKVSKLHRVPQVRGPTKIVGSFPWYVRTKFVRYNVAGQEMEYLDIA